MVESTKTEVHKIPIKSSKFDLSSLLTDTIRVRKNVSAISFKYDKNCSKEDLKRIRELIALERKLLEEYEFEFWRSDYERMMEDDWLISRFFFRGRKASNRLLAPKLITCKEDEYECTMQLIRSCAKFRFEYRVNGLTQLKEFPIEWTSQQGLFSYRPDMAGNPTIYLRIKLHKPKWIETRELRHEFKRLLLYTLECCDRDLFNKSGKAICCVVDMTGATFENVDLELVSWIIKSFKSSSPKLLCYAIIYNLPWFFSATFKLVSNTLMSSSNKQSLKFVYGDEILNYIDREDLPQYLKQTL